MLKLAGGAVHLLLILIFEIQMNTIYLQTQVLLLSNKNTRHLNKQRLDSELRRKTFSMLPPCGHSMRQSS